MKDLKNEIWAYALKNAIEFGKTDAGKVLPKLFQHGLDKKEIGKIMPLVLEIAKKVNSMKNSERTDEFMKYSKFAVEHAHEEKHELPELPEASGKMVFRLAPFPSGALHIGNAKTYLLNALYAEKYNAKTLLVMDDTIGSEEKQLMPESYGLIEEAFKWLGVKYESPVIYKSERLEIYYKYGKELLKKGKAYVCSCDVKILRDNREKGKECKCRNLKTDEQMKRWEEMFSAPEGKYAVRIKTDMKHPNPAFRDRVLFKISDRKHPRVGNKFRVWPTLEMSWAIDDYELGITHIIRGNDLMIETDMEKFIWDIFKWKHPVTIHTGLVKIEGIEAKISKSKAQKEVKSGKFTGWDDPRTWSIQSLKRRGIRKEAIREFVKEIGLNKQDIAIPVDVLYSINRKMIDAECLRYSFIESPAELKISGAPEIKEIEIPVHPDKQEKRKLEVGKKIFISEKDFNELKGKEMRLLHLFNIKLGKKIEFTSEEVKDIPKINWVSEGIKTKILMPDGKWVSGIADAGIKGIAEDEIIQFERFGFARFDKVNEKKEREFWFAHR